MEQASTQSNSIFELSVNQESRYHLTGTVQWTKFLAVAGFVFIGLMIAYGVFMSMYFESRMARMQPPGFEAPTNMFRTTVLIYTTVFAVIYFFPCYFTLRFSNQARAALQLNDPVRLSEAFKYLKRTAMFLGILTIIALIIMVIVVIILITTFPDMERMTRGV